MSNFEPNKKGLAALQKQAEKAVKESLEAVAARHASSTDATIRSAIKREMKKRGFSDFEPGKDMIDVVKQSGGG